MHHDGAGNVKPSRFFLFSILLWTVTRYKIKTTLGHMCPYTLEAQSFIRSYCKNTFTPWDKVGKEGLAAIRPLKGNPMQRPENCSKESSL